MSDRIEPRAAYVITGAGNVMEFYWLGRTYPIDLVQNVTMHIAC